MDVQKYMPDNTSAANLPKNPFLKHTNTEYTTQPMPVTGTIVNIHTSTKDIIIQWVVYILVVLVVITIILIFIHYTITPIFKTKPGGSGVIPVPGLEDGKLFWNGNNVGNLSNTLTPIATSSSGYTLLLDIFIQNPAIFTKQPRIIFYRSDSKKSNNTSANSLLDILPNYNILVALTPDTSDLIVSVLTTGDNMENVLIENVPVQRAFRLGVVVMDKAMEVYMNGSLVRTRTFTTGVKHILGDFYPPDHAGSQIFMVHNLHLWNRLLSAPEIREATPAIASFDSQQPSSSCLPATNTDKET